MKIVQKLFESAFVLIVAVFFISAVTLIVFSLGELWGAIRPVEGVPMRARFVAVLECIGLLTIAVAALELGQTILEEEVQRTASISAPTRVRRFLSRFIVVVVVALSIECLVAVFEFIHESPELLPHAACRIRGRGRGRAAGGLGRLRQAEHRRGDAGAGGHACCEEGGHEGARRERGRRQPRYRHQLTGLPL